MDEYDKVTHLQKVLPPNFTSHLKDSPIKVKKLFNGKLRLIYLGRKISIRVILNQCQSDAT